MSKRYEDARRGLEAASQALSRLRRESGAAESPAEGDAVAAAGLRAALDAARRALEERSRALEASQLRVRELERELADGRSAAPAERPEAGLAERAQRAEAEAVKARQAAAAEVAAINGRLSIQQAEFVRLNSLRRKAENAVEQSELTRREVEDALRRDLRTVHAALDRAASEAGAREARAQNDIQGLTRRLEAALTRTEQLSREQQAERDRGRAERTRLVATLQRASAVNASIRRELADLRRGLAPGADELFHRLAAAESELAKTRADAAAATVRALDTGREPFRDAPALIARLKPAAAAAYERLRELSASIPLSDAERASLRRAASAVAGLSDAVGVVERFLDVGPAGEPGLLSPAVERAAADWEAALKSKGCRLELKVEKSCAAVFDPADLSLVLDQLLRHAFETLPARCRLALSVRRADRAVEFVLEDDGPSPSSRDAAGAFEPGSGAKGLALPLARRALRRWGGDARLEKSPLGGGWRLVLTFLAA